METRFNLGLCVAIWLLVSSPAFSCTTPGQIFGPMDPLARTKDMVRDADLIVRATAVDYSVAPVGNTINLADPGSKVRFTIAEVVKGSYPGTEIILVGILTNRDEWNRNQPPYPYARACHTTQYRRGGEFLLFLKWRNGYTTSWVGLAPVNEQLRSSDDPWIQWVREQVRP